MALVSNESNCTGGGGIGWYESKTVGGIQRQRYNMLGAITPAENSRVLAKALDIWSLELFKIPSQYVQCRKSQDYRFISKWLQV
jgi:hypothetical protein